MACSISFLTKNNYAVVSSCHESIRPVNQEVDDKNNDQRKNDVQERVHPETVDFQVPIVAPAQQFNSNFLEFGKLRGIGHRSQFTKI